MSLSRIAIVCLFLSTTALGSDRAAEAPWWRKKLPDLCPSRVVLPANPKKEDIAAAIGGDLGLYPYENGEPRQWKENCGQVACFTAELLGFTLPYSARLSHFMFALYIDRILSGERDANQFGPSDGWLLIRRRIPPYLIHVAERTQEVVHVTFVWQGYEYNFGPTEADGWREAARVPLPRSALRH